MFGDNPFGGGGFGGAGFGSSVGDGAKSGEKSPPRAARSRSPAKERKEDVPSDREQSTIQTTPAWEVVWCVEMLNDHVSDFPTSVGRPNTPSKTLFSKELHTSYRQAMVHNIYEWTGMYHTDPNCPCSDHINDRVHVTHLKGSSPPRAHIIWKLVGWPNANDAMKESDHAFHFVATRKVFKYGYHKSDMDEAEYNNAVEFIWRSVIKKD